MIVTEKGDSLSGRYIEHGGAGRLYRRCESCRRAAHKNAAPGCEDLADDLPYLAPWKVAAPEDAKPDPEAHGWVRKGHDVVCSVHPAAGPLTWRLGWSVWISGERVAAGDERGEDAKAAIDAFLTAGVQDV